MSYIEPKTDWNTEYEPSVEDMNRIEGNTKQNHDDIVSNDADISTLDSEKAGIADNNTFSGTNEFDRILLNGSSESNESLSRSSTGTSTVLLESGVYNAYLRAVATMTVDNNGSVFTDAYLDLYINGEWREYANIQADVGGTGTGSDSANSSILSFYAPESLARLRIEFSIILATGSGDAYLYFTKS